MAAEATSAAAYGNRAAQWTARQAATWAGQAYGVFQKMEKPDIDVFAAIGSVFNGIGMTISETKYSVNGTFTIKKKDSSEIERTSFTNTYTINPLMFPEEDAPTSEQLAAALLYITVFRTTATFFTTYKTRLARWRSRFWRMGEVYAAGQFAIDEQIRNQDARKNYTLEGKLQAEELLKKEAKKHREEAQTYREKAETLQKSVNEAAETTTKLEKTAGKLEKSEAVITGLRQQLEVLAEQIKEYNQRLLTDANIKQKMIQSMSLSNQDLTDIIKEEQQITEQRQQQIESEQRLLQQRAKLNAIELLRHKMQLDGASQTQLNALAGELLSLMDQDTTLELNALAEKLGVGSPIKALKDMQRDTDGGKTLFDSETMEGGEGK